MIERVFYSFLKNSFVLAAFLVVPALSKAQIAAPPDTSQGKLRVEFADFGEFFFVGNETKQKLSGNVRLSQDDALMRCDTALISEALALFWGLPTIEQGDSVRVFADSISYKIEQKIADCFGHVVLENGRQQLFAPRLQYDLAVKKARYDDGALLTNGKTQIKSQRGDYWVDEKLARFEGSVVATDPEFTLLTDSIEFETERQIAYFLGPTRIAQRDGSKIYTEAGLYDTENDLAEFVLHPQFIKGRQRGTAQQMRWNGFARELSLEGSARIVEDSSSKVTTADTIIYNETTKTTLLKGRAFYRDSSQTIEADRIFFDETTKTYKIEGRTRVADGANVILADKIDFNDELGGGFAEGNVVFRDTAQKTTVRARRIDYNKKTQFMLAVGGEGSKPRPMMELEIDRDTMWLAADTLVSFRKTWKDTARLPTARDTARVLTGHYDVRIFKRDLQAVCDSLSYDEGDSLFVFFKKGPLQPMLWSDSSQFSADTIRLLLKDEKPERLLLRQKSFILSRAEAELFNQIKGRDATAFFRSRKIDRLDVDGSAEAVYFAKDEKGAYMGADRTAAPEMRVGFDNGQVTGIRFLGKSDGKFTPMKQAMRDLGKLDLPDKPVFEWEGRRPAGVDELFDAPLKN